MPAMFVWMGRFSGCVMVFRGRIRNLVYGSCVPCHTIILLYSINHLSLLYDTFQPASHNILMDTKEVWDRTGMTCAFVAYLGSHGRSKFPVFVDCSVLPSSRCINRGMVSGLIFLRGGLGRIKCAVTPASSMAWLTKFLFRMC